MQIDFHQETSLALWFDARDLNADGVTDSTANGNITNWADKSGNGRDASVETGTPELNTGEAAWSK